MLAGLAAGRDTHELARDLVELHPAHDTFPGEVLLALAADVLEVAGVARERPIPYEGIRDRYLPECEFHGRENRKLQYALLCVGALRGGIELDVADEVYWWQTDDFWRYALYAFVAWSRAAGEYSKLSVSDVCQQVAVLRGVSL